MWRRCVSYRSFGTPSNETPRPLQVRPAVHIATAATATTAGEFQCCQVSWNTYENSHLMPANLGALRRPRTVGQTALYCKSVYRVSHGRTAQRESSCLVGISQCLPQCSWGPARVPQEKENHRVANTRLNNVHSPYFKVRLRYSPNLMRSLNIIAAIHSKEKVLSRTSARA